MLRILFCLLFPTFVFGQDSKNIELLDRWFEDSILVNSSQIRYNECWGFVQDGIEYAIAGSTEGTHFFKLTSENTFEPAGFVQGNYVSSLVVHRDFKSYRNYIYGVCDEGLSSLQIIDVSTLPNSVSLVTEDSINFARAHNIFIDTTNALLYACSVSPSNSGTVLAPYSMQVYSLADPLNPSLLYTGPNDIPEVHDAYVRNNIAYLNCGFDGFRVYDFSNPSAPLFIQNMNFYQEQGYNHQGWLSPDGSKYVFADETNGKKLKLCLVDNNLLTIESYFGTNFLENSVPHNIVLSNEFAYVAYYNEGIRIYDMRELPPVEIAHYDTHPQEEGLFTMRGAWGIYPELPSGRIIVSDRMNGLFLFDFKEELFLPTIYNDLLIFPNPIEQGSTIQFRLMNSKVSEFTYTIVDMAGKVVVDGSVTKQNYAEVDKLLSVGVYSLNVNYKNYLGDTIELQEKIMIY
ncbi:MAG: choice-of-anchor B family protein [Crocinitomicaceae bacterium]|nr:choice-of-anchor B family protein [Flavobacteriales bacterium]NQZ38021.1 choice-of-anchor B family protein [Crocinitomicaceae bacterium]